MDSFLRDVRYGFRMLRTKPGFTAVAVIALALGIGANSAIFSVVNAVLLRPLPYRDADRLVMVWGKFSRPGFEKLPASAPELADFKEQSTVFEQIAAYNARNLNLTGTGEPERIRGAGISANLISMLGANPGIGRAFLEEEDQPGRDQVVILSYGLWQRRFASDPEIVGKAVSFDNKASIVVGVMPAGFQFPDKDTEAWTPLALAPDLFTQNNRGSHFLSVIARLKPGVSQVRARAEMETIGRRIQDANPNNYGSGFGAYTVSMRDEVVGDIRLTLFVLMGAVGFVLLMACANVASLLLARAAARQREVAIRSSLGAGRGRLIRQFLTESVLLSLVGGIAGLLLAFWGVRFLISISPADLPRANEIGLDGMVVAFTLGISLLTGVLFGLAPAFQASTGDLTESLKEGGRGASEGAGRRRVRNLLVISEFALALVLSVGAGLMIKSFARLQEIKPGFEIRNLLTMRVALPRATYSDFFRQTSFFQQLIGRIGARPGVESIGAISSLPLSASTADRSFIIDGRHVPAGESSPDEELRFVSAGYFTTMGIPLLRGRHLTDRDGPDNPRVVIINQAVADRYWPDEDPLGKRISYGVRPDGPREWREIVGVVGNVRHNGLDGKEKPEIYLPYLQPLFGVDRSSVTSMYLAVRTGPEPSGLVSSVRAEVAAIDPNQPVHDVKTMEQRLADSVAQRRFNLLLLAIFAAVALVLAAVGIYGIVSYSVTQRTHEIGIRMAIGARTPDVLRLILGQGMALALTGIGIGLVAAFVLTRIMASLLYEVSATDPMTFIAITLVLSIVAFVSTFVPARRATKVDPMEALRWE